LITRQLFSMPDSNPLSLNQQLAQRAKTFCANLGLAQNRLARLLKVDESQWSRFLNGQVNLSSEKTLQLHRLLSLSRRDLELKFGSPEKLTARLMHLQESGRELAKVVQFTTPNDGWLPGRGMDPNDSGDDITTVRSTGSQGDDPGYDDLTRTLAQVQALHKQAISTIEDYESRQRARVNATGSTQAQPRKILRPKTPGPRGDLLP
jgi:transcriptional regulator with XRE-family HTH domain